MSETAKYDTRASLNAFTECASDGCNTPRSLGEAYCESCRHSMLQDGLPSPRARRNAANFGKPTPGIEELDENVQAIESCPWAGDDFHNEDCPHCSMPNPTRAPAHYVARNRANGVEPGTDRVEWERATRGDAAVVAWALIELGSKAMRIGMVTRSHDQNVEDLFKIEQAVAVLRRIWSVKP